MPDNGGIRDLPIDHRIRLHRDLLEHAVLPSCLNCESNAKVAAMFEMRPGSAVVPKNEFFCGRFKSIPPIEVIVCGCGYWQMAIPF